ncbi:hypothetical protein HJG60_009647 [Phyllostomus discolor]|uniref:Uncharacterized protein n=1 Tax=Phyllostomus discolor TaxID=89673 RepID=A0A834B9N2_9CHIR|nr:hypothetical protein HJG60_009647 [Phyllostomus discolor]
MGHWRSVRQPGDGYQAPGTWQQRTDPVPVPRGALGSDVIAQVHTTWEGNRTGCGAGLVPWRATREEGQVEAPGEGEPVPGEASGAHGAGTRSQGRKRGWEPRGGGQRGPVEEESGLPTPPALG